MKFTRVHYRILHAITIPMYKVNTLNILLIAIIRWILVIVIVVPCQTPRALKSLTNKGLRDYLCMSILEKITTTSISEEKAKCVCVYLKRFNEKMLKIK
ncbi:hypothetical protein SADUNF_Sadunf16G0198000 [Salix dunnii]|uniref:Uncharacterized protein n=1 Tax=Salix dunnii TaxID=1413687 RepID=A0A835MH00_9ROSI|nr:hypothetical protein SADUNF_Sadunf16G0198000 [Salix dunnii]